jgi:uncharacterized protein (DUF885 family)
MGTPDGSRPGMFYVDVFNLNAQPNYGMETLSLHEASPGHHFQITIAQAVTGLPQFHRSNGYSAYSEGWALYSESIGKELGLFTDPLQGYGRLCDENLRAIRLVVDTGLHYPGWSREKTIAYMREHSSMAESDAVAEVERYSVWPGQALGYKVGQLEITRMRREAEATLGAKFNPKAFHRQLLIDGALPLAVLETKLREWEAAQNQLSELQRDRRRNRRLSSWQPTPLQGARERRGRGGSRDPDGSFQIFPRRFGVV